MNAFKLESGRTYSRKELADILGISDRSMRQAVRDQRRLGVPIAAMPGGGYKLAEGDAEKRALLSMYRSRALDELTTYYRLLKTMQVDGQEAIEALMNDVQADGALWA